ncbi:hypothetical protein M102_gp28 [Streptococcus phage M102]|uniref:hypothetical protein n=1 Tax=Streptococcus phage M102 TaxID=372457 RepID=UPI00015968D8|nr:hypothetical protein M102_gp28 [Streptococcus phage M102]CAO77378.1 hypothetical protein [Streptococcus phage M102]
MQELQVNFKQAKLDIVDKQAFEQNINTVVKKYKDYQVTAQTIRNDKQTLADLRKLIKQISDKRLEIKRELTAPVTDFEKYVKRATQPLSAIIDKIASDVKDFDDNQKSVMLDTLKSYVSNKASELLLDARVFDSKLDDFVKKANFKSDCVTLKKSAMQDLDEMIAIEFEAQKERLKAKSAIASACEEHNLSAQAYIRMLDDKELPEILIQIKADYDLEQAQKVKKEKAREVANGKADSVKAVDLETGEIIEDEYTQSMTLEVYFRDTADKEQFKKALLNAGFEYKKNYAVRDYKRIEAIKESELKERLS